MRLGAQRRHRPGLRKGATRQGKKVWISPHANGRIQAVGTDAAGRRQYPYHRRWQEERAEEKFDRVFGMSKVLPQWRIDVAEDLWRKGLDRDRVRAIALHVLDRGYFRAGGEQYEEENESRGILEIEDPQVVRSIRSQLRRDHDSDRLLVCRTVSGWADLHAEDLNSRVKEMVGPDCSVKDLRTCRGTVLGHQARRIATRTLIARVAKGVSGKSYSVFARASAPLSPASKSSSANVRPT